MKNKLTVLFAIFIIINSAQAQNPAITPQKVNPKVGEIPRDTLHFPDPKDKNIDFIVIHNAKGNVVSQGELFKGKRNGVWREYAENGVLKKVDEYKNGIREGTAMRFSVVGMIEDDAIYRNNQIEGYHAAYNGSGRLKLSEFYKNGVLHGTKKSFYENDKVQEESVYKNGVRDGLCRWYLQSGNPSVEYTYLNGELEGPSKEYDANGSLKREGSYKNNVEEGQWNEYENNVLVKKIEYKNGEIIKEINQK